jgi:hypothetical protein
VCQRSFEIRTVLHECYKAYVNNKVVRLKRAELYKLCCFVAHHLLVLQNCLCCTHDSLPHVAVLLQVLWNSCVVEFLYCCAIK